MASTSISEALQNALPAFDLLVSKRLNSLTFDKTIVATVVDNSYADTGYYICTDGTSKFDAYYDSTDIKFPNGTVVYVTVPQNNFANDKIIVGRYVSDDTEYFTYVDPMSSFIDITKNLITSNLKTIPAGLKANGDINEIAIWSIHGRAFKGYDRLAIKADFKAWLKNLGIQSGTYGLRLDIISTELGTTQTSQSQKLYSITLNVNDFYGDPYNYETYYTQAKVVDISEINQIESMRLVFYQANDFKLSDKENDFYINPKETVVKDTEGNVIGVYETDDNIFVDNVYISLGYNLDKFTEDTVLLYTLDSSTFASYLTEDKKDLIADSLQRSDYDSDEEYYTARQKVHNSPTEIARWLKMMNQKDIYCRWIHKLEDESFIAYESYSEDINKAKVHWYKYILQEGINDPLAGSYWQEIPELVNKFEYLDFDPDVTLQTEKFKVIIEMPTQEDISKAIYDDQKSAEIEIEDKPFRDYFNDNLQNNETYYQWVMRGLEALDDQIMNYAATLEDTDEIRRLMLELRDEYLAKVAAAGLKPTDAEANKIRDEYTKKIKNIEQDLISEISTRKMLGEKVTSRLANVNYYYSAILDFTNEDDVPNNSTIELIRGLQLTVDADGYHGNYRIYDEQGDIISKIESQKKRIITANWNTVITGDRSLDNIEQISWKIPTENTMIQYPENGIEYSEYEVASDIETIIDFTESERDIYTYNPASKTYTLIQKTDANYNNRTIYYYKSYTTWSPPSDSQRYFLITQSGKCFQNHTPGEEEPSSSGQIFRIKEFYTPTATNNTIYCEVRKNNRVYSASATLRFGPTGTNGTEYSFELEIENKVPALTINMNPVDSINIIPHLYDYDGNDIIGTVVNKLSYGWFSPTNITNKAYLKLGTKNNSTGKVSVSLPSLNADIEQCQYHILYAEIQDAVIINDQSITFNTVLPIPVRSSYIYTGINGADRICYNSQGVDPAYYKKPYYIYKYIDKKTQTFTDGISWEMSYGEDTQGALELNYNANNAKNFYPILSEDNTLIAPAYYLKDNGRQIAVNCIYNGQIIWTQPLYIYQNSYASALLNSWNGKLTIDEENGSILATVIGAGAKDDRNRFNGVLMGDISEAEAKMPFGLYGYNEGQQSFGFNIDGTGFIGKSGRGQIRFDGNNAQISSLSYNVTPEGAENQQGTVIDLDDGYIDMHGANFGGVYFKRLDSDNSTVTIESLDGVLTQLKTSLQGKINKLNQEKNKLNEKYDAIDRYVFMDYDINNYQKDINTINQVQNIFSTIRDAHGNLKYNTDKLKLEYLQDNNLNYLISNEYFTPIYVPSHSRVKISTTNPYFFIDSQNSHRIIHIGDDTYFLKTDNFIITEEETQIYPFAYEWTAAQKQTFLDWFTVSEDYGKGLLLDLQNGYLLGYNFKLKGVNNGQEGSAATKAMKDSYFELNSSGDPFLKVHYKNVDPNKIKILNDKGLLPYTEDWDGTVVTTPRDDKIYKNDNRTTVIEKDLIQISKDDFYLQSWNYIPHKFATTEIAGVETGAILPSKTGSGVLLDLTKGALYGHDFTLSMIDTGEVDKHYSGSYVAIGSNGQPYLKVHYQYIADTNQIQPGMNWNQDIDWAAVNAQGVKINKNIDLINIGKGAWSIKSRDFQEPKNNMIGRGIYFNLNGDETLSSDYVGATTYLGSLLKAYSFRLDAYKPGVLTTDITRRITINSAATDENSQKSYVTYTPNYDWIMQQADPDASEAEIIQLCNKGTDTQLETAFAAGKVKKVTQAEKPYYDRPIHVGALFSVGWKGLVEMDYIKATQGGKIGPFAITDWALYSNNGYLANNKDFNSTEPTPRGVYLGRDGLSVRNTFAVFKYPINAGTADQGPRGASVGDGGFSEVGDFILTTTYPGSNKTREIKSASQDAYYLYDAQAEQSFIINRGTDHERTLKLHKTQFMLNGNSVINGKTVLNGNSYIFGRLEVGSSLDLIHAPNTSDESYPNDQETYNQVIFYANTSMYGTLKVTGKTYIGDGDARWNTSLGDVLTIDKNNAEVKKFGFIVYRNTLISGNVVIGNNLIVGMANAQEGVNRNLDFGTLSTSKNFIITNTDTVFRSYLANNYFYGNVSAAGNFQAGLYNNQDSKIYLYGFTIQIGRGDEGSASDKQSNLTIFANTQIYGSLTAGNVDTLGTHTHGGRTITLWGGQASLVLKNATGEDDNGGYFKLSCSSEVYLEGGYNNTTGGYMKLKAGPHNELAFVPNENGTSQKLTISTTGPINMTGGSGSIVIDDANGVKISTSDGGSVSYTMTTVNSNGKVTHVTRYTKASNTYFQAKDGKITLSGSAIELAAPTTISGSTIISGDCEVTGNLHAANFKITSSGASMGGSVGGMGAGAIGGGGGSVGLGGWSVVEEVLQHGTDIQLDPAGNIYFNGTNGKIHYSSGLALLSGTAITLDASTSGHFQTNGGNLSLSALAGQISCKGTTAELEATSGILNVTAAGILTIKSSGSWVTIDGSYTNIQSGAWKVEPSEINSSVSKITASSAELKVNKLTIGTTYGIDSSGNIVGSSIAIPDSNGSVFKANNGNVTIKDNCLNYKFNDKNSESHSLSQLGKLAYENDVKKKIKLNDIKITVDGTYYEKVNSGGTVYYTGSSWNGTTRYAYYKAGTGSDFSYGSSSAAPEGYGSYFMGYYDISSSGTGTTHFKEVDLDQTVDIDTNGYVILGPDSGTNDVITLANSDVTVTYN